MKTPDQFAMLYWRKDVKLITLNKFDFVSIHIKRMYCKTNNVIQLESRNMKYSNEDIVNVR